MRAATAKATRRDIRRAVGVDGLAAVNATAYAVHEDVLPRLDALEREDEFVRGRLRAHLAVLDDFLAFRDALTFVQRLRWLFTGRR